MELVIGLEDIMDGNFKFYLNDKYRKKIFSELKDRFKDWRIVAKNIGMDTRNLFGIRRGFEYYKGRKTRFITSKHLLSIKEILDIEIGKIEKNIVMVKSGFGGKRSKIKFPITVDVEKEGVYSLERSLAEHIMIKMWERNIFEAKLPYFFKRRGDYIALDIINFIDKKLESKKRELFKRGLKPEIKDLPNQYIFLYRNPGTNNRVKRIVPKKIILDEVFMKEFGKWVGDRCGGPNRVGVANKEWNFIVDFKKFLKNNLTQPEKQIDVTLNHNNELSKADISEFKTLFGIKKAVFCKTQYGKFAFSVTISNKMLKNYVFDIVEKYLFSLLHRSLPSIRYAFYAGLFDADGSIDGREILWSFGLNLRNYKNEEIFSLLKQVVKFKHLLQKDGFNPQISRKVSNTEKSNTLKYDIKLCQNQYLKGLDFESFKAKILPYITHKKKINKFNEVIKIAQKKQAAPKVKGIPEVNIGMVGH